MRIIRCDVLVIGSGAAGLRAAIEAHDRGAGVVVVGKCWRGDAHTVLATGGINAALGTMDREDSWVIHAADTLREGRFLADYRAVGILCKKAPAVIKELVRYGVKFARSKGKLLQRYFGAHSFRRTCFVGDETGRAIEKALVKQALKRKIKFLGTYVTSLLKAGDAVNGAFGFDMRTGEILAFNSKCVILAAGGYSRLYRRSSSRPYENTGDGIALALAAGADLQDMEMMQFHPTGMVYPKEAEGVLVTEAVRGEGGRLFNSKDERFMERYDPERKELGPRDEVARAVYNEIREGRGTRHGGVWLDITHKPKTYILKRLPKMHKQFMQHGIDISKEKMEVAPTAHYSMGGVKIRTNCSTNVRGLFAAGEVTGGLHGANRLGGNSLAETMVFGKIVGLNAARYAKKHCLLPLGYGNLSSARKELESALGRKNGSPGRLKAEIQDVMWRRAGIIRNAAGMRSCLKKIRAIKKRLGKVRAGQKLNDRQAVDLLDARSMAAAAEIVVRSALLRKESRGAHFRSDFPNEGKRLFNIAYNAGRKIFYKISVPKPRGRVVKELRRTRETRHGMVE